MQLTVIDEKQVKEQTETILNSIRQIIKEELNASGYATQPVGIKELCKYLSVTEPTISRWRKKGLIPFFTVGTAVRFNVKKVIDALEKADNKKAKGTKISRFKSNTEIAMDHIIMAANREKIK